MGNANRPLITARMDANRALYIKKRAAAMRLFFIWTIVPAENCTPFNIQFCGCRFPTHHSPLTTPNAFPLTFSPMYLPADLH